MQAMTGLRPADIRDFIRNPHDALFRALIRDEMRAHPLIRDNLPAELQHLLEGRDVRTVSAAFVNGLLRQTFADGVFEIGGRSGRPEAVALIEHVWKTGWRTFLQLAGYLISAAKQYDDQGVRPTIVVIVIHTGSENWRVPATEQSDGDGWSYLARGGLRLRFCRCSANEMPYESLSSDPVVRAVLGAQSCAAGGRPPSPRQIRQIFRDLSYLPLHSSLWGMTFLYGLVTFQLEDDVYRALVREADPRITETEMQTRFQQMLAERDATCRAEARAEALAEGRAEGFSDLLLRLVQRRFGAIPGDVEARIRTAPAAEAEAWVDAVFDSQSLEELLENGHQN